MLWDDIEKLSKLKTVAKYKMAINEAGLTILKDTSNCSTPHVKNMIRANIQDSYTPRKRSVTELERTSSLEEALAQEEIIDRAAKSAKLSTQSYEGAEIEQTSPHAEITWAPRIHREPAKMKEGSIPFSFLGNNTSSLSTHFATRLSEITNSNNTSLEEQDTSVETKSPGSTNSDSNQISQTLSLDEALAQEEALDSSTMDINEAEVGQTSADVDQTIPGAPRNKRKPNDMIEEGTPASFFNSNNSSFLMKLATRLKNITSGNNSQELDTSIELPSPESTNSDTRQNNMTTSAENALVEGLSNMSVGFRPFNKSNKPTFISKVKVAEKAPSPILEETEVLTNKTVTSLFASPDFDTPGILRPDETPIDQLEQKFDEVFSMLFPTLTVSNKASKGIMFTAVVDNGEDLYSDKEEYYSEEDYYSSDEEMSCAGESPSDSQLD